MVRRSPGSSYQRINILQATGIAKAPFERLYLSLVQALRSRGYKWRKEKQKGKKQASG